MHKPADSGVVVGSDARRCSLALSPTPTSYTPKSCGERACLRWGAKRPRNQATRFEQTHRIEWICDCYAAERDGAAIRQAPSPQKLVQYLRYSLTVRPPSQASQLPQLKRLHPRKPGRLSGRPLERLRSGSAQWATRHGCRVSRARPWMADRGGPTEQDRSEGTLSLGEGPNDRGKSAWLLGASPSDPP